MLHLSVFTTKKNVIVSWYQLLRNNNISIASAFGYVRVSPPAFGNGRASPPTVGPRF